MDDQVSAGAVVSRSAIEGLCGPVTPTQWGSLQDYAALLLASARRYSLISRGAEQQLGLHLVDSAAFTALVTGPDGAAGVRELADLGTGAGLPGVVVALLRPTVSVKLIDSRNSRVVFLKQVVRRLGLDNVEILHSRIEALAGRRAFDLVASRALGSLEETLAASLRMLTPTGSLVLFKGPRWVEEEARALAIAGSAGCELGWVKKVELPGYGRSTWFVEFHVKRPASGLAESPQA
jgi:16S rRNA (guanine527-N7)-methyltransferase